MSETLNPGEVASRVLAATSFDYCEDVWWRTDTEYAPVTFLVNCNDLFAWGFADCERITAENIDLFEECYESPCEHSHVIFCCRSRGMRPQGAMYKHIPKELWPILDACGPEREVGPGNPKKPGE